MTEEIDPYFLPFGGFYILGLKAIITIVEYSALLKQTMLAAMAV